MSTEPKYLHPSVTSKIIDTSSVVLTAAGLNNMFVALEAEKGAPNEAMYISSASQFIFTLGEPNFSKWGQAGMNAINWLRAGGGLWVIRVVPDDETFASLSFGIGYNESETYTNDEEEYKNLELTADQIKRWNLEFASEDDNKKYARGLSTGKTVPVEKFYAGKANKDTKEIISVESKLGTMTKDAIELYNINNGTTSEETKLEPLAIKKEVEVTYGMSFAGNVKAEAAKKHVRGYNLDYTAYSVSTYANLAISNYDDSSSAEEPTTALVRHTTAMHDDSYDTLFTSGKESESAVITELLVHEEIVDWKISKNENGDVYLPTEIVVATDEFENLFAEAHGDNTPSTDSNVKAFPKMMKAVYEITKDSLCDSYVDSINNTFYGIDGSNTLLSNESSESITAISEYDAALLQSLNSEFYGPCYEKLFDDALTEFNSKDFTANLKLTLLNSEAKWQYCYDVVYTDGTPFKTAAMTENYIHWYNLSAPSYAKVKEIEETDKPSTGIYERMKTFNVNYAVTGLPVYGFYMTNDAIEIFNTSKPESRDPVTSNGEMADDSGLESMCSNVEVIFNQTASVNSSVTGADLKTVRALNYLAPLFTFANSAEEAKEGFQKVKATLTAADIFKASQVRNLSAAYREKVIGSDGTKFAETCDAAEFIDIGLYDAAGNLVEDKIFEIDGIEVPEIIAKILVNNKTEKAKIPLSYVSTESYPVPVWNIVPSVNATASGNSFNLVVKVSLYATADGATLLMLEDQTGLVSFKAVSTSEYTSNQNFCVVYEDASFVPNSAYVENVYKAIGFCATTFTDRSMDNVSHEELTPSDIKRGYVVDENRVNIQSVDPADMRLSSNRFVEFARFLPKGSGPWYNKLAVSLTYENAYNNTYPDWSMFTLSVIEKSTASEIVRESFDVALDPDAISGTKESLFIEDVVNRYSSYLTCVANYDNLQNFIDTKLKVTDVNGEAVKDEDGNDIVPSTDKVIKYIFNQITLEELNTATFGDDYKNSPYAEYAYTDLMSAIGYDSQLCHLDTTLTDSTGEVIYNDPFVSEFYYQTVDTNAVFYLAGGTRGHGWGYEVIDPDTDETVTTATLTQALTRAYNGTTDPLITNTQTCVFDIMMDANYDITVKNAMSDLASMTRGDCITILDMNHDCANASQAVAKRKDQMQYNTYFTSIFSQTLGINDEWTGKPVRVTPTFFLATKIPQNDAAYTEVYNFVGPRRGTLAGFTDISWLPTEPEKTELYKNQINYIEQDTDATMFATENTSQKITSPLSMIHAVRSLLKLKRQMEQIARNYRMEFSTDDVRGHLQEALNNIANNKVLAGGYEYISPVVSASAYDRQQKICRVKVDLAFIDIMERFVFEFVVNRAS